MTGCCLRESFQGLVDSSTKVLQLLSGEGEDNGVGQSVLLDAFLEFMAHASEIKFCDDCILGKQYSQCGDDVFRRYYPTKLASRDGCVEVLKHRARLASR